MTLSQWYLHSTICSSFLWCETHYQSLAASNSTHLLSQRFCGAGGRPGIASDFGMLTSGCSPGCLFLALRIISHVLVVDRIQFIAVVGLQFPFSWWLSLRGCSQLLKAHQQFFAKWPCQIMAMYSFWRQQENLSVQFTKSQLYNIT